MAQQKGKNGDNANRWIVLAMVLLVLGTGVAFSIMGQNNKENAPLAGLDGVSLKPAVTSTIDVDNGSAITFNPGLPTQVDVWEDPQCPGCKNFENVMGDYLDSLARDKKATVRFHMLSFKGPESVRSANAAFCAADENHFLDFHNALFSVQTPGEGSGFFSTETLIKIGKEIGIDSPKFTDCVSKGSKADLVQTHYDSMSKFGVQSTPTIFINGKIWTPTPSAVGFSLDEFRSAVEAG
jgi:protein-disulfide isomerase